MNLFERLPSGAEHIERTGLIRMKRRLRASVRSSLLWTKRATRETRRVVSRPRYHRIIERMHLATCTPCQYDWLSCAHQGMRYQFRNYHLPLNDLAQFLRMTEDSGYFIECLHLTGPGEPLLWKSLAEGLKLIRSSRAVGQVELVTNGLELNRLNDESWDCIDVLRISLYPASAHIQPLIADAVRRYGNKIIVTLADAFTAAPEAGVAASIPCRCKCTGPMFFDQKIFLFCGPPVFDAAQSIGVDPLDYPDMFADIGMYYLDGGRRPSRLFALIDPEEKTSNHELCRYCFANGNRKRKQHPHIALQPIRVTKRI